jgi:putative flippase GtrA
MKHFIFGRAKSAHIQFLRYFFVGGSASVIDILIYTILISFFSVHYAFAAFVGYMFGLSWNYIIGLFWVFERRHGRMKEILMVFLIALGGLFWTWIILFVMIDMIGIDAVISKLISQIIVLFWNFGMRKYYVFN